MISHPFWCHVDPDCGTGPIHHTSRPKVVPVEDGEVRTCAQQLADGTVRVGVVIHPLRIRGLRLTEAQAAQVSDNFQAHLVDILADRASGGLT